MTAKQWTRRRLLTSSAALAGAMALSTRAFSLASTELGAKTVTMVSDGNLVLPVSFVFPDVPEEEMTALMGGKVDQITPDCTCAIVRNGERVILFDVGSGPNFMPTAGTLLDSLAEADIDPSEVTDVVFTHAHPDHLWGLTDDFDELIFADAAYHMNSAEWDYWRADDTLEKTPEARKTFVVGAQNRFAYLEDRIQLFGYGDEILPGIEAVDTHGHTPGHTSFAVHDGSSAIMIVGDAVTNDTISFAHPEWPSGSDQDTEQGIATRKMLLDRLVADKMQMVGFHMPHPALGSVEKDGDAYRYVAA